METASHHPIKAGSATQRAEMRAFMRQLGPRAAMRLAIWLRLPPATVRNAVWRGVFPASWYAAVCKVARAEGVKVPMNLFTWRLPE